jgi:uracil phosphoribosyltransferase
LFSVIKAQEEIMVADFAPPCGTISWFAIQEGQSRFAIFDTFDDDAGRNAFCVSAGMVLFFSGRTAVPFIQRIREKHLDRIALVNAVAASTGVEVAAHFERIELRVGDVDRPAMEGPALPPGMPSPALGGGFM